MGRAAKNRSVKPVQQIELSEDNTKKKAIAAVLFLIIGVALLVYCFVVFINPEEGWTEIKATQTVNDSGEFVFQYYLGANGANVKAEERAVTLLYNQAAEKVYKLFHEKEAFEGIVNLYSINRSPNTELEVDEVLYGIFSAFKNAGSRYLYIAPVYSSYSNLFYCTDDAMLVDFDPLSSEEIRGEYKTAAEYFNDPKMIDIQLLGDNRIKLFISEEYLEYAKKEDITDFIGLSWLKNAFEADYFAETMIKNGFTHGSVSSYDGFIRNFDSSDTDYSFNIFDKKENNVYLAGVMGYRGAKSIVFLRSFAMNSQDEQHYYRLKNGEIRTPYLDVRDCVPKYSAENLVSFSGDKSCAEIALEALDIFISEELDLSRLGKLAEKGVFSIYSRGFTLVYNEEGLELNNLYDRDGVTYRAEYSK